MADVESGEYRRSFPYLYLVVGGMLLVATALVKPGVYSGSLDGRLFIMTAENVSFVSLRAETKPAWHWFRPRNHRYQQVTMTCTSEYQKSIQFDLAQGTWSSDGDQGTLDAKNLAGLIMFGEHANASDPGLLQKMQNLLVSLQQMHSGTFLPPQHHAHHIDKPIRASYAHFTIGQNWGVYGILVWLLVWPAYLVLFKQPSSPRWFTPRKAFLVTGFAIVALDLMFFGIHAASSPGAVSEAMEGLLGLLNAPAFVVLGECSTVPLLFYASGAVSWSVLVSTVVWFRTEAAHRGAETCNVPVNDQPD